MFRIPLRCGAAAALIAAAFALAGCNVVARVNDPLPAQALNPNDGPISRGGYRLLALGDNGSAPEILVLLSFSGGGKRSAAFGYGVLKGLRDLNIRIDGHERRLLDEIDLITSVSGGSFPAAYYGLYRDRIFKDFENDFLNQDLEGYIFGTYLIPWKWAWMFSSSYGTNDRMAEVYDKLMFHGATFADLARQGRPMISVNATNVDLGLVFSFTQDQFDLICSDLSSYPVSRAVAASNGFPIIFTPITLKSYSENCAGREPLWVRSDHETDPLSRSHLLAEGARHYLDPKRTRYVHLMDGGIADNLAMRSIVNILLVLTREATSVDLSHIRRVLLIAADGQAETDDSGAREAQLSGLAQIFNAVSGTQIDSYNFETMIVADGEIARLRDTVREQRCAVQAGTKPTNCGDVQSFFAHLSLGGISDPAQRERLAKIPTGLTIPADDVAQLVAAGAEQVRSSPVLRAFAESLSTVGPEHQPSVALMGPVSEN